MSNLKLQKLLYDAQGHYLGGHGQPLFEDPIEAWVHGPVVPSTYYERQRYGSGNVDVHVEVGDDFD